MLLFGLAKFFTSFFVAALIFQRTALAAAAGFVLFRQYVIHAPDGITRSDSNDHYYYCLLHHSLDSFLSINLLMTCMR